MAKKKFQVPAAYKEMLAKPAEFVLSCNGEVREVVVSRDESEWSINFKKALIVLFQTKVDSYNVELEQNRVSSHQTSLIIFRRVYNYRIFFACSS